MKKLLVLILIAVMMAGCVKKEEETPKEIVKSKETVNLDEDFAESSTKFAWSMFKELESEDGGKNIFFSPTSVSTALTMTYEGAEGNTAKQMKNALGYNDLDKEKTNENYAKIATHLKEIKGVEFNQHNSMWFGLDRMEKINEDFRDIGTKVFNSEIYIEDFELEETVGLINNWVKDSTKGKIEGIVDDIDPNTVGYIINAIYFKGDWKTPFDAENTAKENFNNEDSSSIEVDMMNGNGEYEFYKDEELKSIKIPYTGEGVSMHCILPQDKSIAETIASMEGGKWKAINDGYESKEMGLKLPKFNINYEKKLLNESLIKLGMVDAFNADTADFTGIGEAKSGQNIYIGKVLHSAVIEVDEEGSEAAAVTSVEVANKAIVEEEKEEFFADRPFIYLIADEDTGQILFLGAIKDMK